MTYGPTIAALYVRTSGPYFGDTRIDPWDETRDARKYAGPLPVIAHPPCQRWGKFYAGSPAVIRKTGIRQKLGDDGGCFQHAIWAARTFGGVVEHPFTSKAWPYFGLSIPKREGGWVPTDDGFDGWTCCVEQGQYGHYARKPSLLAVYGVDQSNLPELKWAVSGWEPEKKMVDKYGYKGAKKLGEVSARGGGRDSPIRIDTPLDFKNILIGIVGAVDVQSPGT